MSDFPTTQASFGQAKFHKTANLCESTLNGAISGLPATFATNSVTTFTTWPTATYGLRIRKADGTNNELVYISSRSGTTHTVGARGLGGTTAVDHDNGELVTVVETAEFIEYLVQEVIAMQGHAGVLATMIHASVTTTPYTATSSDFLIPVDATSAAATVNLPTAVGIKGRLYAVKKTDSSANSVTVDGSGSETIDGLTTAVLYVQNHAVLLQSDGANWQVLATNVPQEVHITSQAGTYSVVAADLGTIVHLNGTFTVTFPNGGTGFRKGASLVANNIGTGTVTFAATGPATIKAKGTKLASQYGGATWYWNGTDWYGLGDLTT